MILDILVRNVALWGNQGLCDVAIADGRFASIGRASASSTATLTLDAEGRMAVPGFVEPHIHLDKAMISERAPVNVSGTLTEAIEILWEIKASMKGWDYAKKNPDEAVKIILAGDSTGAKTEKDRKRMMTEIGKLLGAADGKLDVKDYERTVATLMSGGSDPVSPRSRRAPTASRSTMR